MARPCKSAKVLTECSQTKEELQNRIDKENSLKGSGENINPPDYLNKNQVDLFNYIKQELEASDILGNLDVYILAKCAIAIDRLQEIEKKVNEKPQLMFRKEVMSTKDKYDKDFYRCCNELSLSPQSRAKLSNINLQAKADDEDPLLKILRGNKTNEVI